MINPTIFGFQHSGKNTDGSAFTSTQYGGAEISVDGATPIALPIPFATDGQYQFPRTALGTLANGTHTFAARILHTNGNKSVLSPAFSFDLDTRTPDAPFGLSAS